MKFSVATNFDNDLPARIADYGAHELFGKLPKDAAGGGRASYMLAPVSAMRLREHVRAVHRAGMTFNYLINFACMGNREFTRAGQKSLRRLLDWLSEIEVDSVTVSVPYMLELVKRRYPHFMVKVGVFASVDTPRKAKFFEDLGADCIAIQPLVTVRNFPRLRAIREAVGCELQLIANSTCLLECPMTPYHNVGLSHASQAGSQGFFIDYCLMRCLLKRLDDPAQYIKSPWIRPEDVHYYEAIGYSSLKILERGAPTETLVRRVRAYHDRQFDGNLLDLVQCWGYRDAHGKGEPRRGRFWELREFLRPRSVRPTRLLALKELAKLQGMLYDSGRESIRIDNRELDGFIERFVREDCSLLDCETCRYCDEFAARAVSVDQGFRDRCAALARGILGDLAGGGMWGLEKR